MFQLLPVSFFKMPVDLFPSDATIAVYPHPPQVSFQLRLRGNAAAYRWFTPPTEGMPTLRAYGSTFIDKVQEAMN
ncbi:MAG: hypothetical protein ACK480_01485 [Planctomycetota bacterium]